MLKSDSLEDETDGFFPSGRADGAPKQALAGEGNYYVNSHPVLRFFSRPSGLPRLMWQAAGPALVRCLELAHQSFLAGGLPVGSVIVDGGGERVSEGRNRAYDPAGGPGRLAVATAFQ